MTSRRLVPCYPLAAVLSREQMDIVRPFLRTTFTETWAALCAGTFYEAYNARWAIRHASANRGSRGQTCDAAEGRCHEEALYVRARHLGVPTVLGPPRKSRRAS